MRYEQAGQFTIVARHFAAEAILLDDVRLALIVFAKCPAVMEICFAKRYFFSDGRWSKD